MCKEKCGENLAKSEQKDADSVRCEALLGCPVPDCKRELGEMSRIANLISAAQLLAQLAADYYSRDTEMNNAALAVRGAIADLGRAVCADTAVKHFIVDAIAQAYYMMLAEGWSEDQWQDSMKGHVLFRTRRAFDITKDWLAT